MRSHRLLLLLLLAMITGSSSVRAAVQPMRLLEIFVVRVVEQEGAPAFQRGLLHASGTFARFDPTPFDPGFPIPADTVGRDLIHGAAFFSYDVLGTEALANFDFNLTPIAVGPATYFVTSPSTAPRLATGQAFLTNDQWDATAEGDIIADAAASMGAFPFARGSLDAACLVVLPAGIYTVHLEARGPVGGTALLEIYLLP